MGGGQDVGNRKECGKRGMRSVVRTVWNEITAVGTKAVLGTSWDRNADRKTVVEEMGRNAEMQLRNKGAG